MFQILRNVGCWLKISDVNVGYKCWVQNFGCKCWMQVVGANDGMLNYGNVFHAILSFAARNTNSNLCNFAMYNHLRTYGLPNEF